jgi:hypothetical protein
MTNVSLGLCEVNSCMQKAVKEFVLNDEKLRVCLKHSFVSFRSPDNEVILDRKPIANLSKHLRK